MRYDEQFKHGLQEFIGIMSCSFLKLLQIFFSDFNLACCVFIIFETIGGLSRTRQNQKKANRNIFE